MEMDEDTVKFYFEQIYRVSRKSALHYNVNRVQSSLIGEDGGHFYNHPLLYPYRQDDRIIYWDVDPIQHFTRAFLGGAITSHAYARAATIKGISNAADRMVPVDVFHGCPI